jgi:hypothetical protein
MNLEDLEARVCKLEQEVQELRALVAVQGHRKKDWRRTIGVFHDDPIFDEVVRAGREWRERENQRELE